MGINNLYVSQKDRASIKYKQYQLTRVETMDYRGLVTRHLLLKGIVKSETLSIKSYHGNQYPPEIPRTALCDYTHCWYKARRTHCCQGSEQ